MEGFGRLDEGVRLPDGSGYLGTLNVYHELHCVVNYLFLTLQTLNMLILKQEQMYHWLYKETYLPNMTPGEYRDQVGHLEHCLEALREGVMCNADVSIILLVPILNRNIG